MAADSFGVLASELAKRLSELKLMAMLRVEDGSKDSCQRELAGLDTMVRALEGQVATLKSCIQRELTALPKVEALIEASKAQSDHLNAIASNLPARLPKPVATSVQGAVLAPAGSRPMASTSNQENKAQAGEEAPKRRAMGAGAGPREPPRWYLTEAELASVPKYMATRMSLDKVNAALDELAGHAAANQRLMAVVRQQGAKLAPAERKRATELLHSVASKEGVKGSFWFVETDLREGPLVKVDKSGKVLLTLLRHLGRLSEVRCSMEGQGITVYVMQEDPRRAG